MRLLWSSRSPFVRKVMVATHEVGVADRIVNERVVASANKPSADVMAANPLNNIPTLKQRTCWRAATTSIFIPPPIRQARSAGKLRNNPFAHSCLRITERLCPLAGISVRTALE
jgi:hypothetical protein